MTPKQLVSVISNTCQTLYNLRLIASYKVPVVEELATYTRVSWPSSNSGACYSNPFGSLEQYTQWLENKEFICTLFDFSIVRASYIIVGSSIVGHSLLYWPYPVETKMRLDDENDACDALNLFISSPSECSDSIGLRLRSPMRFDFSPDDATDEHPEIHLHTQFEHSRIFVHAPITFNKFIKIIFRTFYHKAWLANSQIESLHEQPIDTAKALFSPASHCIQFSWT